MIVGTRDIDRASLMRACSSIQAVEEFAINLVPLYLRHIDAIVNNQKYIVAIVLRDLKGVPYMTKKNLAENLLEGVVVKGTLSTVIDAEDLLTNIDMNKIFKELFREELKEL